MAETETQHPEWMTVGGRVAVMTRSPGASRDTAVIKTIERVSAKSVTVDGERYPVDGQSAAHPYSRRYGGSYGPTEWLADPASPEVLDVMTEQTRRVRASRAQQALSRWNDRPTAENLAAAKEAVAKLAQWLA
jgi:hypothetical protein